jgi:hypothetical protein
MLAGPLGWSETSGQSVWLFLMNSEHAALLWISTVVLLGNRAAVALPARAPRSATPVAIAAHAPETAITIVAAGSGASLRSNGASHASLDLGRVSYFKGTGAPGQTTRRNAASFVISTRFALTVACPGGSPSSRVNVTMALLDADDSQIISIDGTKVGSVARTLVESMPCGSGAEHRLDVEVPVSAPAGNIGTTIAFVAAINRDDR